MFNLLLAGLHFAVDKLYFFQHIFLKFGIFGLDEEGKYFVIVPFNEGGLVLVDDGDIGLVGFDDFGEEPIIGDDILFQLPVYDFETRFVIGFGFLLHAHNGVDRVDELMLKVAGRFETGYSF